MPAVSLEFFGSGTSQGVPIIGCECSVCTSLDPKDRRLRSSVLIATSSTQVLIDCGPDFRQQMLRTDHARLDAVVLTHEHMDHVTGLDDLRPLIFAQNEPMPLWATDRVEKRLREQFAYAFSAKRYPGAPEFELRRIEPGVEFTIGDQRWIPILGEHGSWPVLGYRIGDIVYLTDVSGMDKEEQRKIRGAEVLVVNALRKTPHISHFSLDEAIEFALETEVPNVYFTHISHHMGHHHEVNAELPKGMALAYDGLKLKV